MDKLKNYLRQHESAMEPDIPGDEVWDSILAKTAVRAPGNRRIPIIFRYVAAASMLAAIVLVVLLTKKDHTEIATTDGGIQPKEIIKDDTTLPVQPVIENKKENEAVTITPPAARPLKPATRKAEPVDREALAISKSYNRLINFQLKKLRSTAVYAEEPGYFSDFKTQLRQIGKDESAITNDIKTYGLSDELLEQLINLYQQKLNLLKSLQAEVNKMNNKVREQQDPSARLSPYHLDI